MVDVEKGLYKGSKPYSCGHDFEFTLGKRNEVDMVSTAFTLEYFNDTKEIREKSLKAFLRTNDSSDDSNKFIKWVFEKPFEDIQMQLELNNTFPFSTLEGQRITAAFIYGIHWYLFGGRHYCRTIISVNIYDQCKPIPINDWIKNCDEVQEFQNNNPQEKSSPISVRIVILMVIIIVAVLIILVLFVLIFKEVTKKGSNTTNQTSSGLSAH